VEDAAPRRIQLRRSRGWRKPVGTIVVARPGRWGNPFPVDASGRLPNSARDRRESVERFRAALAGGTVDYPSTQEIVTALAGHDLACWCPLLDGDGRPVPCHADVLLEIANGGETIGRPEPRKESS
jgi:hypothetical protein